MKNKKQKLIEGEKFARKCDITGEGMDEGFCFGDGQEYAKYEKDALTLAKQYGYKTLAAAYKDEAYYHTAWEDESDFQYIVKDGVLVEIDEQEITSTAVNTEMYNLIKECVEDSTILISTDLKLKFSRLLNNIEIKPKEYYFLFGESVCRVYHDEEFEEVIRQIKEEGAEFSIHKFTDGEHPTHLLEAADGWMGIAEITKEEYEQLKEQEA